MPTIPQKYIDTRTEILAKALLTSEPAIVTPLEDQNLHYLVQLYPEKSQYTIIPAFGVILVGTVATIEDEEKASHLANKAWKQMEKDIHLMPVLMLVFTLDNDQGYIAWVQEPCIGDIPPLLWRSKALECHKVSPKMFSATLKQIRKWYENLGEFVFQKS
jgi:hypothetical protein